MSVYKPIDKSNVSITETQVYKTQTLHSGSSGVVSTQYRSGSRGGSDIIFDISGSYWASLHNLFYQSGSALRAEESGTYNQPPASLANWSYPNPQRVNKFFPSGSVISIPQKYFGERIKPQSFKLVDNSTTKTVTIQDDGYGNLYPVGNSTSHSISSPSSSDNYVGNIFYNYGIVTITDTGSYSSSINYTDITTDKYTLEFKSTQTISTHEYIVVVKPHEFNYTMNSTIRGFASGTAHDNLHLSPWIQPKFTASGWTAYTKQIQLYSSEGQVLGGAYDSSYTGKNQLCRLYEPVVIASLPRPIKIRDDMSMIFKIRIDI